MNEDYRAYLRSPEWRARRLEFLEDAEYQCQECGSNKKLQVHHLSYDNLGDETEDDVEVLCKECHEDKEIEKGTELCYDGSESY